jgi:hypothetical protein
MELFKRQSQKNSTRLYFSSMVPALVQPTPSSLG